MTLLPPLTARKTAVLGVALACSVSACGAHASSRGVTASGMASPPRMEKEDSASPPPPPAPMALAESASVGEAAAPQAPPAPSQAPPARPERPAASSALEPGDDVELTRAKRMLEIEARLRIEVEAVARAAERLREIARASNAQITSETVSEETATAAQAEFTLRVPAAGANDLFRALDALGAVRQRNLQARDVGQEYYDAVIRLRNLEVTRTRLEQIVARADKVDDVLRIEGELTRLRGEMEQIKGQLRFMKDRVAFATVFVSLFTRQEASADEVIVKPKAQFFPGLHSQLLLDVHGDGTTRGFYGAGLSLGISRQFELRLDGYRRFDQPEGALDAFTATLGGRFYSEYLGGGRRRWLNPNIGLHGGYARFEQRNEFVAGASLGLELFKTEGARVDFGGRALALFGTKEGAHVALIPTLGVDFAF